MIKQEETNILKYPLCPKCGEKLFFTLNWTKEATLEVRERVWKEMSERMLREHLRIHKKENGKE